MPCKWLFLFAVGVYVIRYLGPIGFGKLSYSISFVALFSAVSKLGLDQLVIRGLVKQENPEAEIIGTAFVLKVVGNLFAIGILNAAFGQLNDDPQTTKIVLIISFSYLLSSFDVLDLWFQSQVLSKSMAIVRSTEIIISSISKLLFCCLWAKSDGLCLPNIGQFSRQSQRHDSDVSQATPGSDAMEDCEKSLLLACCETHGH